MNHGDSQQRSTQRGSRHATGRCVVCSQLTTLSTACTSTTAVPDRRRHQGDKSATRESKISTSLRPDSAPRCDRRKQEVCSKVGRRKCCAVDKDVVVSKSRDDNVDQESSSGVSPVSAQGSSPDNTRRGPTTSARQSNAVRGGRTSCRCCLLGSDEEQSPVVRRHAAARQNYDASNAHNNRQDRDGDAEADGNSVSDSCSQVSSDVSLPSALASSPDNNELCLVTNASRQSDMIKSGRVVVLDLEDWIKMWKCLSSGQIRGHNAHPDVITFQSNERPANPVNGTNDSVTIPRVSSTEMTSTLANEGPGEKNGDFYAAEKSQKPKTAEKRQRNREVVNCCSGQCTLRCADDIAPRVCFSKDDDRRLKNEDRLTVRGCRRTTLETRSTPSDGKVSCLMSELSAVGDDHASCTASAAIRDCGGQMSVSDKKCHRELTAAKNPHCARKIPEKKVVLSPNCCRRYIYGQKTDDEVANEGKSTNESGSSADNDNRGERQPNSTNDDRDTAYRCDETATEDNKICTSLRQDATPRCGRRKQEARSDVGRVVDKDATVSKSGDNACRCRQLTTVGNGRCDCCDNRCFVALSCTSSRATEASSATRRSSSSSDKELNETESTQADDYRVVSRHCEVTGVDKFILTTQRYSVAESLACWTQAQ